MSGINMVGRRYGRLVVLSYVEYHKPSKKPLWACICDCGTECVVRGNNLRTGTTRSCGCLSREILGARSYRHGLNRTRLQRIHRTMLNRCNNPKAHNYKWYGGRGITVCPAWLNLTDFAAWARASGYDDTLSIDRIDPTGNYEPSNCQWLTLSDNIRKSHTDAKHTKLLQRNAAPPAEGNSGDS